jgi:hypothetical protein
MYIKLNNNEIEKYPYSEWQLKSDNPQVSFPATISKQILEEFSVYEVVTADAPSITYKQDLSEGIPVNEDGVWKQTWVVTDKSTEKVNAIQESNRKQAYIDESDPLFFKWQRGEIDKQVWLDKVVEIKQRWV